MHVISRKVAPWRDFTSRCVANWRMHPRTSVGTCTTASTGTIACWAWWVHGARVRQRCFYSASRTPMIYPIRCIVPPTTYISQRIRYSIQQSRSPRRAACTCSSTRCTNILAGHANSSSCTTHSPSSTCTSPGPPSWTSRRARRTSPPRSPLSYAGTVVPRVSCHPAWN